MSETVVYGDPQADGNHVVVRHHVKPVAVANYEIPTNSWSSPRAVPLLCEAGSVEINGEDVGLLPERGASRGLTQDFPCEFVTGGVFRVVIMQTSPLPPLPRDAVVALMPAEYEQIRLACVELPVASITVSTGDESAWEKTPNQSTAAIWVRGDEKSREDGAPHAAWARREADAEQYRVGDFVTVDLPDGDRTDG